MKFPIKRSGAIFVAWNHAIAEKLPIRGVVASPWVKLHYRLIVSARSTCFIQKHLDRLFYLDHFEMWLWICYLLIMFRGDSPSVHLTVDHRTSCHRCGNIRKSLHECTECPQVFCNRCTEKMMTEHGLDVFKEGCPVVILSDDVVLILSISCYWFAIELITW